MLWDNRETSFPLLTLYNILLYLLSLSTQNQDSAPSLNLENKVQVNKALEYNLHCSGSENHVHFILNAKDGNSNKLFYPRPHRSDLIVLNCVQCHVYDAENLSKQAFL